MSSNAKPKKDCPRTLKCGIVLSKALAVVFTPASVVLDGEEGRESGQDGKASLQQVTAIELFEAFKTENKTLHTRVDESLEEVRLAGWIAPFTILLKGPNEDLELIKEAWRRHLLRSPNKFVIRDIGEISSIGMDVIQQAPFMPLTKALHEAIKSMNESKQTATQESIAKFLKENYQYVHIPSLNIIYDCLGLLIKERMVYHTGNGYFINSTHRAEKTADTHRGGNESSAKENDCEVISKKKGTKHEKLNETVNNITPKHSKHSHEAHGKTAVKKQNKQEKKSTSSRESPGHKTDLNVSKETASTEVSLPLSGTKKQKQRSEASNTPSESSAESQSDEGRIRRGFLGRKSGRKPKDDKEKVIREESKKSKEKKGVLSHIACFIKSRTLASDASDGGAYNADPTAANLGLPAVSEEPKHQLRQSFTAHEEDVSFTKEDETSRSSTGEIKHIQLNGSVVNRANGQRGENASPSFTRSRSFVTAPRKRPMQITRSNSFTNSRTDQRRERVPNHEHEKPNISAWINSVSAPPPRRLPSSQNPDLQNGFVQRRPQSSCWAGRSGSFKESTRPYSIPHTPDSSRGSWSNYAKGSKAITRSKSFGNPPRERNVPLEKLSRLGEKSLHPGVTPLQQYNIHSNVRAYSQAPRVRTVTVPIKGKHGKLSNSSSRKSSISAPSRQKTEPTENRQIAASISDQSQNAHGTDEFCTSPICNDRCRINELKPMNCKCNEHEVEEDYQLGTRVEEAKHDRVPELRLSEKVLQNDIGHLYQPASSADICLDKVSSTSGSDFALEMKIGDKQPAYMLNRTGGSEQKSYCDPFQFTPEEAKVNSSLTFIGII